MSYYYTNPAFGAGLSNLAEALFPDPLQAVQAGRLGADRRRLEAEAMETELANEQMRRYAEMAGTLADTIMGGGTVDPSQIYASALMGGPDYMEQAPGFATGLYSTLPGLDQQTLANLVVGAGGDYGDTQLGAELDASTALERAHIAAGPGYAGVAARERIAAADRDAELREAMLADLILGEDQTAYLAPERVDALGIESPALGVVQTPEDGTTTLPTGETITGARGAPGGRSNAALDATRIENLLEATVGEENWTGLTPPARLAIMSRVSELMPAMPLELAVRQAVEEYLIWQDDDASMWSDGGYREREQPVTGSAGAPAVPGALPPPPTGFVPD